MVCSAHQISHLHQKGTFGWHSDTLHFCKPRTPILLPNGLSCSRNYDNPYRWATDTTSLLNVMSFVSVVIQNTKLKSFNHCSFSKGLNNVSGGKYMISSLAQVVPRCRWGLQTLSLNHCAEIHLLFFHFNFTNFDVYIPPRLSNGPPYLLAGPFLWGCPMTKPCVIF